MKWITFLARPGVFSLVVNVLQVGAVAAGTLFWKLRRCRVPLCLRLGIHDVVNTPFHTRVCDRHDTPELHSAVRKRYFAKLIKP